MVRRAVKRKVNSRLPAIGRQINSEKLLFGVRREGTSRGEKLSGVFSVSNMPSQSTEPTRFVRAIYLVAIATIALGWLVLIGWIVFRLI